MRLLLFLLPFCLFADCPDNQVCCPPPAREERLLFPHLTKESYRLYNSLDCEGKNRAIELSKQYDNKNEAVQKAAKEMGVRNSLEYRSNKDYQRQMEERSGQEPYTPRYGY